MTAVDIDDTSTLGLEDAFAQSPVGKARWRQRAGETLASALRRILIDEITSARAVIGDPDLPRSEAIHLTRRCLKRVRSLWDVFDPLPGANRDGRIRQVRDTARLLAAARDADVMAAEARRLHERAEGRTVVATERFLARCEERARHAHLTTPPFDLVAARLRACEADARSLPTVFEGGRLLADSLVGIYRRGRRDWREIEDGAGGETLHDWRKRVKHRHHLSAMVPVATSVTSRSIQADLGQLGEFLGEEHDLAVMKGRIEDDPDLLSAEDGRDDLLDLIARRRRKLTKIALELGADLYALRTRSFENELAALRELA